MTGGTNATLSERPPLSATAFWCMKTAAMRKCTKTTDYCSGTAAPSVPKCSQFSEERPEGAEGFRWQIQTRAHSTTERIIEAKPVFRIVRTIQTSFFQSISNLLAYPQSAQQYSYIAVLMV
jgi:hypothetical protein